MGVGEVAELKTKEKSNEETDFLLWGNLQLNLCFQALQGFTVAVSYVLSLRGLWGK